MFHYQVWKADPTPRASTDTAPDSESEDDDPMMVPLKITNAVLLNPELLAVIANRTKDKNLQYFVRNKSEYPMHMSGEPYYFQAPVTQKPRNSEIMVVQEVTQIAPRDYDPNDEAS